MTEKQLVQKLNNLREIQPDASWLKANRDCLYSQISNSGAKELSPWSSFVINFTSLAKTISMPAVALASFMVFVLVSSVFSHQLLNGAKPNQSLYIARVFSENAKLNTMFNDDNREKMAAQFAASHAQDIMTVLSDPNFNNDATEVAKLNASFQNEIDTAKQSISKISKSAVAINVNPVTTSSDEVFSASSLKDDKGLSLDFTTSTPTQILEEAKNLFDQKDYTKASQVLELIKQ